MSADPPSPYTDLDFNAPLSDARASELVASLRPLAHSEVVDLGCGWAELLLRVLAEAPTARGVGIDQDRANIARARANAAARGLGDRVRLECGDAAAWSEPTDVAIVVGATHVFGGARRTLDAIRPLLRPGGRLLLGEGVWEATPTPEALTALAAGPGDLAAVPELVEMSIDCGYRLLSLSTASLGEWDAFESRYCAGRERWLLANPESAHAESVRLAIDTHRQGWLRGYRGILGFAFLTLAVGAG